MAVASALALVSGTVLAQEFPAKPNHIYVGFAPGDGTILSESDLQHSERTVDRIIVIDRGPVTRST